MAPTEQQPSQKCAERLAAGSSSSRQCLLNLRGRTRNSPLWNASRYFVRPSSGCSRRILVQWIILLCAVVSAAHFPQVVSFFFFFQLPWSLRVKSLEARINETSSHGLNEVLSEVGNQNACWWVCLDILCLSSGQCVFSYVIVLQLQ